jgi:hypothetical protein
MQMATKQEVLKLLSDASDLVHELTVEGSGSDDWAKEEQFTAMFSSIDTAIETIKHYAD